MKSTSKLMTYAIVSAASARTAFADWGEEQEAPANVPTDIRATIMDVTNYILGFIAIIATLMVIYGGIQYLTAGGNDEQVGKAKKTIINGVIGLVICGMAYALVSVVATVITA